MGFQPNFLNKTLKELSYYSTGGSCLGIVAPRSTEEVRDSLLWVKNQGKPFFVLGGGTNSLVSDEPYDGYVISFHEMTNITVSRENLLCLAGADNTDICRTAYDNGLGDISWMNRLPGQIGGTARMNARCYGGEISAVASKVKVVTKEGEIKTYTDMKAVFFGYKDTVFMDNGDVICEVELSLQKKSEDELTKIKEKMDFCESDRTGKGQFLYPTCGCVFKNNYDKRVSVSSGFLLEKAGVKNKSYGGAEVSSGHANFVYNKSAASSDIINLSLEMRELVYNKFGVWLEYEMEILGNLPDDLNLEVIKEKDFSNDSNKNEMLSKVRKEFQEKMGKK